MPTIEISDEVFKHMQNMGETFVDTPNSVLERVFGLQDEAILDKKHYDRTILLVLLDMDGEGERSEVLKRVGEQLSHLHSRKDLERYKSKGIRWKQRASSQISDLVSSGLMESETPRGICKLTEKGREEACKLKDKEETD